MSPYVNQVQTQTSGLSAGKDHFDSLSLPQKFPCKTNQTNLTPRQFAFILRQIRPQKLRVKTKQNARASRIQITANHTKGANTRTAREQSANEQRQTQRQTFIQSATQ